MCGLSAADVLKCGFSFYKTCVVQEDLEMVYNLERVWNDLIRHFSPTERMGFSGAHAKACVVFN